MRYKAIQYEERDEFGIIRFSRPKLMNALNSQMRAEITDVMRLAQGQKRAMVITGEGPGFCAGQDLGEGRSINEMDIERMLRDEYEPMLDSILGFEGPVIAAVNGAAVGAGANLALAADIVLAARSAYFSFSFGKIGLIPDAGGTWFLPQKVGLARSLGSVLLNEKISAEKAVEWGMIWEAIADSEFEAHWLAKAQSLASGPTAALAAAKKAIRSGAESSLKEQLDLEARLQGEMGRTQDFKEGVIAFIEKRSPDFRGQ